MSTTDRRRSRRLDMKLPILVRHRGEAGGLDVVQTTTSNISTDGFYFDTNAENIRIGDVLDLDLTLPPAAGVSAFEGHASAAGDVVRVEKLAGGRMGVGGRFRAPIKLLY